MSSSRTSPALTTRSVTPVVVGTSPRAQLFAERAGLCCVPEIPDALDAPNAPYIWVSDDEPVELRSFVDGYVRHALESEAEIRRFSEQGLRQSDLGRAVGAHKKLGHILDVTAGLGRDACTLAAMGCQVTALERSPVLAALWEDALERSELEFVSSLSFRRGEALDVLKNMSKLPKEERPQVVFLDPMFPERKKKAAVKKELRALKSLLVSEVLFGDPEVEGAALVQAAREVATERVVVKRPLRASPLGPVSFSRSSKVLRIDVLLTPCDLDACC
ncbi:MAG: class I SAM-dependent methyltransferase [Deltaproteobacteria bacterium]|nr:class I SAM-dependent methyltransferase [Deltaproteobacteria bacterium]